MKETSRRLPALLAAVGLLCSVALEVVHVRAYLDPTASSFCSAGQKFDCATVALSRLSVVGGVPVPVWGILGFSSMLIAALRRSGWLLPLSAVAALASVILLGAELVAIHSVCLLCEAVHVVSFALLFVAFRDRAGLGPISPHETRKVLGVPAAAAVLAYLFVPPYWAFLSWRTEVPFARGFDAEGHAWVGAEHPKVTLHEYTDYGCPHCAVATNRSRRFLAKYPSKFRLVRHHYARMPCNTKWACIFARAADCAGDQGKFWEMDSWLFEHAAGKGTADFDQAARDVKIDPEKLTACMDSPAALDRAKREYKEAVSAHVSETPAYFIDGKRLEQSAAFATLSEAL